MPEITVYSAFELISNGLKLIKDMAVSAEVKAKVSELYEVIIAGQNRALESGLREQRLVDEVSNLKEQLRKVEAWEATKQRYELKQFHSGHFAYALKKETAKNEPFHYLCATCFSSEKLSILHPVQIEGMRGISYTCKVISSHGFHVN